MNDVFIVDGDSGSSTTTTSAPAPGYVKRSCDACGKDWGPTRCSDQACHSIEFTDRYIEPVPLHVRVTERIRPKPKAPRADAATVSALRGLQRTATSMLADLHALDVQLRAAVIADVEEAQLAQAVVHQALSIEGDASAERVAGLSLSLRAFAVGLTRAIDRVEETP